MGKIPWIPLKTMEHGVRAKFHGFHGEIPMLSMLAWDSKNCNNKKQSHTQLDSRKQVIAFQDRVITINIKEAQHPLT